jgi:hypothetical protein
MIVAGTLTNKMAPALRKVYDQMPEPRCAPRATPSARARRPRAPPSARSVVRAADAPAMVGGERTCGRGAGLLACLRRAWPRLRRVVCVVAQMSSRWARAPTAAATTTTRIRWCVAATASCPSTSTSPAAPPRPRRCSTASCSCRRSACTHTHARTALPRTPRPPFSRGSLRGHASVRILAPLPRRCAVAGGGGACGSILRVTPLFGIC